jgi:hypothetical protein
VSGPRYEKPTVTLIGRINSHGASEAGGDRVMVDVETESGWRLRIVARATDDGFDATLTNPFGSVPYESRRRATAEEAVEKACDFLRDQIGYSHVATVMRLMAETELRP